MQITKDMTIAQIIEADQGIANILMASGMHCLGCAMAHGEDLGQACAVHGIDATELTKRINAYLASKQA
jgi:hybrid cluster-associated redox disulfide protein